MQLQEYNLQIKHISGAQNFFADVLSRNPTGLTTELHRLKNSKQEISVAKVDLKIDKGILKQLKKLPKLQQGNPNLQTIKEEIQTNPAKVHAKYSLKNGIVCTKDHNKHKYWRIMLPKELEAPIFKYVHQSLGHSGTDKCLHQISEMFYIRNLGRKLRKFVASCDTCQKVKHPNKAIKVELLSHLPKNPGDLTAVDFYGPLPAGRGGMKHLFVS